MKRRKKRFERPHGSKARALRKDLQSAWEWYRAGSLARAERSCREILRQYPKNTDSLQLLGLICLQQNRATEAIGSLEEASRIAPEDPDIHNNLGKALCAAGDLTAGEKVFRRSLELKPRAPEALGNLASVLAQQGKLSEAIDALQQAVSIRPELAAFRVNLGNALCDRGDLEEAVEVYGQALLIEPDFDVAHFNLGNVLQELGRLEDAIAAFRRAIDLRSDYMAAHNNLGSALIAKKSYALAIEEQRAAIEICPDDARSHYNLGIALSKTGRVDEAIAAYREAIRCRADYDSARESLGRALYNSGQHEAAADSFREWLQVDPGNPIALHMLSACTGRNVESRASDAYVERVFDRFSDFFDKSLENLEYRAPHLIVEAVSAAGIQPHAAIDCLDAGCGTGLCGQLLRPFARRLVGVDLSSGMLSKSRQRGVYDELTKAELTEYVGSRTEAFDLIVAADTLNYFGELESVFTSFRTALRAKAHLVFTLECETDRNNEDQGYRLASHGRYCHSEAYLRRALQDSQLRLSSLRQDVLRKEGGQDTLGFVVVAARG